MSSSIVNQQSPGSPAMVNHALVVANADPIPNDPLHAIVQQPPPAEAAPEDLREYIDYLHAMFRAAEIDRRAELRQANRRAAGDAAIIQRPKLEIDRLNYEKEWKDMLIDAARDAVTHEKSINRRLLSELEEESQRNDFRLQQFNGLMALAEQMDDQILEQSAEINRLSLENERLVSNEAEYKQALGNASDAFCKLNDSHDRQTALIEAHQDERRAHEQEVETLQRTVRSQRTCLAMGDEYIAKLEAGATTTTPPLTPPTLNRSGLQKLDTPPNTTQPTLKNDIPPTAAALIAEHEAELGVIEARIPGRLSTKDVDEWIKNII